MARNSLFRKPAYILATAFALATATSVATAQPSTCAPRGEIVDWLAETYAEKPAAYGMIGNHRLLEIHVSEKGSWTAIMTDVNGHSCLVSAGHSWTSIEQKPVEETSSTDIADAK